jgi:predicted nucleic acid-binding protein
MMRIVVDTNIIIRILIKSDGVVAQLFYQLKDKHELYASYESLEEINKHKLRLIKNSGLNKVDFEQLYSNVISNISIVPVSIIPTGFFVKALQFTASVDYDDIPFVATSLFLQAFLWTSDRPLFDGLKKKGMPFVLNNSDIKGLLNQKSI